MEESPIQYPNWWPSSLCLNLLCMMGNHPLLTFRKVNLVNCQTLFDSHREHLWIKEHSFQKHCFISFLGLLYQVTTDQVASNSRIFFSLQFWRLETHNQGVDRPNLSGTFRENLFLSLSSFWQLLTAGALWSIATTLISGSPRFSNFHCSSPYSV